MGKTGRGIIGLSLLGETPGDVYFAIQQYYHSKHIVYSTLSAISQCVQCYVSTFCSEWKMTILNFSKHICFHILANVVLVLHFTKSVDQNKYIACLFLKR